jgi:predicted ATPase
MTATAGSTAGSLVGRSEELETLGRLLDEACDGNSRLVVVSGEPGIGKTSLLAEFAGAAAARGCLVLQGRASELERELPFAPIVDAFDSHLASLDRDTVERLAPDELRELGAVFPALGSLQPSSGHPRTAAERFRAHHAIHELVERLAARQPVLITLDDLHWADGASLELLGYSVRRPVQAAAMALLAFRTGQADPRLASMVEAAARAGEVRHIALGPLDPAAAERLAGIEDRPDRARLYRESGGNPLYLLQLARDSGQRAPGGPLSADAPAGISAAIGAELESLSDAAGRLVQAASVAGDPFDFDLAVAVAELEEAEALGALDELIGRDLIRPGDVPRDFAFRHPLVRSAVYEACPPGVRLAAHQRAAVSLAERGAPVIARAHHVEHAARPGDAEAVAVLREAGHAAAARAPTSAARWFSDALRILPGSAPVAERVELLTSLAGSQAATGHLEESRSSLLEALGLASGDGGGAVRTRLVTACAAIDQLLGRHVEAQARLQGALSDLGERPSPDGASLMIELAFAAFHRTDYELMLQWAARARRRRGTRRADPQSGSNRDGCVRSHVRRCDLRGGKPP